MPRKSRSNLGRRTVHAQVLSRAQQAEPILAVDNFAAEQKHLDAFVKSLDQLKYEACVNCKKLEFVSTTLPYTCARCKKNPLKFSRDNNMQPSPVPPELQNLTKVEQHLIARVNPVMRVYQLQAYGSRGQYHYTGNIMNVEQNIDDIARTLPNTPANLGIVVVRRAAVTGHIDFRVRKMKVLKALEWLKCNNPFYADIEIDLEALSLLPEDGNIANGILALHEDGLSNEAMDCDRVEETAVPMAPLQCNEEAIQTALRWPTANPAPLNEFRTAGYVPMAFPHLFPDGKVDFLDNTRAVKVTHREWCEFLMRFEDKRFAQDPRFRFHCLNTLQRHDACRQSAIFAKKNDFNGNVA